MYDVLLNLVFGSNVPELTDKQILALTWGSVGLTVLAFTMISISLYKLMLYIAKF